MNSNSWWESFSEGWPSGHTMIAVGMAIAIHPLIRSTFWRLTNIVYPILVAWSVSTAFHWLSDVIAGGVIGIVIGFYYAKKYAKRSQPLRV
jgi:membrane-associated phospholipid phosphatase